MGAGAEPLRLSHDPLRLPFACDLLGALQQSVVDVLGAGNLGLDHVEVLRVRHGLRLDRVGLGGRRHQVGRVLGAVDALREALVGESLRGKKTYTSKFIIIIIFNLPVIYVGDYSAVNHWDSQT